MDVATAEREFFTTLNTLVEPWARMGCLSPARWPMGVVVLETTGRRSGRSRSTPVMAMLIEDHMIVATARGERSDWFRNIEASPDVRYWLGGEPRNGRALTFAPDREQPMIGELPALVQDVVRSLSPALSVSGCRFAVLVPKTAASQRQRTCRA